MECPGHVSLPALGDDLAVSLDDLTQQTDLGTVGVHHLDLLWLEAEYEVATLGSGQRIGSEPELKLIIKQKFSENVKNFLFLLWQVRPFWIERRPSEFIFFVFKWKNIFTTGNLRSFSVTRYDCERERERDGAVFERKFPVDLNFSTCLYFACF